MASAEFTGDWYLIKTEKEYEYDQRTTHRKNEYRSRVARRKLTKYTWFRRTDAFVLAGTKEEGIMIEALKGLVNDTSPSEEYGARIEDLRIGFDAATGVTEMLAVIKERGGTWQPYGEETVTIIGAPNG